MNEGPICICPICGEPGGHTVLSACPHDITDQPDEEIECSPNITGRYIVGGGPKRRELYEEVLTIRITEKQYEVLKAQAEKHDVKIVDVIRWLIDNQSDRWRQAYESWKQYWDYWGGEFYYPDKYQDVRCCLCGDLWHGKHDDRCVYISVCKLLGVEPK